MLDDWIWILDLLVSLIDQGFRAFLWIFGFRFGFSRILDQRVFLWTLDFGFSLDLKHSFGSLRTIGS
jgi:hypothetical protein